MRDERWDNAILTHNRRDAVVVVQRVEVVEGRRMPVGREDHEERGNPRTIAVLLKSFSTANTTLIMSRRAAIVEEFDDDTDLPLPSHSLPDTGSRGAIIEAIVDSDDGSGDSDEAPELLNHTTSGGPALKPDAREGRVTDITPYKMCAIVSSPTRYPSAFIPRLT